MEKSGGFTLIELLLVVGILIIIAAISIPKLLRARMSAEETSAISSLRTINTVQVQVITQSSFPDPITGNPLYANFAQLESLIPSPLDSVLMSGEHVKSGFQFSIDLATQTPEVPDYKAYGLGVVQGTNIRNFIIDPSGVIHFTRDGTIPNITSPSL
jgi:type IV pilus assembly protein PilA